MALDERAFFSEKPERRTATYTCSRCHRTGEYEVRWIRRTRKHQLPPGARPEDRAKLAKLRDHLIRVDDELQCKVCGRRFEIPSMHSLLFLDQFEGLPRDVEDEAAEGPAASSATEEEPAGRRDPQRRGLRRGTSQGWR